MLGVDIAVRCGRQCDMDDTTQPHTDVIELVLQLCTRIGMMMEDAHPLALDASSEGLERRVSQIARSARTIAKIADAAEALMDQ